MADNPALEQISAMKPEALTLCAPDLGDALLKWHRYLRYEKQVSRHTLRAYGYDVSEFISFLAHHNSAPPGLNNLSETSLRDFRSWLSRRAVEDKAGPATRARALSGVKNFLRWLDKQGIMHNPAINAVRSPKLPHKLPRPLFEKQALDLLAAQPDEDWIARRDRALFTLLYGCGLRIDEALSLNVGDMPRDGFIRVMGKGQRERQVPCLPIVEDTIKAYLDARPFPQEPGQPIFLGVRGKRLHQGIAQKAMRTIRSQLELPETATPHALRHSFASHLLQNGANLREIQDMLGHASLRSTQRYTEINAKELMEIYSKAHPRNSK